MHTDSKSIIDRKVGTRIAKMLYESQQKHGYLKEDELERISDHVGEPLNIIQDVVGFFPHYRRTPSPKCSIHICRDMTCRLRGAAEATRRIREWIDKVDKENLESDSFFELHEASCLGRCDRAFAATINDELYLEKSYSQLISIASDILQDKEVTPDSDFERAKQTISRGEIDYYRDAPETTLRYSAVRNFVREPIAESIIKALETAGLVGMGGAGAPTSRKWDDTRKAIGTTKFIVCNADESEPGTFKDRELLLAAPHLVIEGMIMAGLVVEAQQGFIYVRHEYHEQIDALKKELSIAEAEGAIGKNIFGSGRSFTIEIFVSPGGYVCGEQTALIEAIEGKRSEPRNRPPELETNGLYDQPTVLNNVETFAWIPAILLKPPTAEMLEQDRASKSTAVRLKEKESIRISSSSISELKLERINALGDSVLSNNQGVWFKNAGYNRSRGKRYFSISGDLNKPAAYEVPCGITLGELIESYAGGMKDGAELQAVAMSGPSGGFLPARLPKGTLREPKKLGSDKLPTNEYKYPDLTGDWVDVKKLPLDISVSRELGYSVGAGIVVYGAQANMLEQAIACSRFFQRESCGKCVPCRLGTRKIADLAELYQSNPGSDVASYLLENIATLDSVMREPGVCICALGASASAPLSSYIKFFRTEKSAGKA